MELTRLDRVFAATNGSEAGQHAAVLAHRLAEQVGAELRILSVETAGIPGFPQYDPPSFRSDLPGNVLWARGIPGIEIVRAAETWQADLVVLGRRQRSRGDQALGSTAEAVVRRRAGPCLLIPSCVDQLERMLIALDGTQRGLGILPSAALLAGLAGLSARAVYAVPDAHALFSGNGRLPEALGRFPRLGGPDILEIRRGSPVEEILGSARANRADLLVIGVRRGGPPGEAGSGHIGLDLLREAPLAILTVPI